MATESPDLRVSLDLLDIAIDHAVDWLTRDEVMAAVETIRCADYYRMYARMNGRSLNDLWPEDVRYGLDEVLYDNRCHETAHPYFVQAVIRALIEKRRRDGLAFGGADFAREFPAFDRGLREEHLAVTDEGRLVPAGWRPPVRSQPIPVIDWVGKIDADDVVTGLELLEELEATLGDRSVVEVPIVGKRRRWQKMWDEDVDRRHRMYETSRERIANLLYEKGELKALVRLPEKYPEQERYRVVAIPSRVSILVEVFLEEYERRPDVRIRHVSGVPGLRNALQRKRRHERRAVAQPTATEPPGIGSPDFAWIDTCEVRIAHESRDILTEVKHEFDLEKSVIRISAYPHGTDDLLWPGYHEAQAAARIDVARLLVKKRILTSVHVERGGGQFGLPSSLLVECERAVVVQGLGRLHARVEGKLESPITPAVTLSNSETLAASIHGTHGPASEGRSLSAELGHEFRKEAVGELGRKTGSLVWWLLGAALLLVTGLVPTTRNAVLKWARESLYEAASPGAKGTR